MLHSRMKRIVGFLLDLLFFWSFVFLVGILGLFVIYGIEKDISLINVYLQSHLKTTLLIGYSVFVILYLKYYWILPVILKQTVGQRLAGNSFESEKKVNLWRVFLKTVIGRFWDFLFFPYALYCGLKKRPIISTRLSGITVTTNPLKNTPLTYLLVVFFSLVLVGALGVGTYVYRTGYVSILERFTDYEKQTETLTANLAYQDATYALEKYKQYHGEDQTYAYYHCIIEANLAADTTAKEICTTAREANNGDDARVKAITIELAKVYAALYDLSHAEILYKELWDTYQYRELDMKNYVVVLSELAKHKEAEEVLTTLVAKIPEGDFVEMRDFGHLFERLNKDSLALEQYLRALALVENGNNESFEGELHYYIGVIFYKQTKYEDAKKSFEQAKSLNKDFAEPAESYIILIKDLKNSITT